MLNLKYAGILIWCFLKENLGTLPMSSTPRRGFKNKISPHRWSSQTFNCLYLRMNVWTQDHRAPSLFVTAGREDNLSLRTGMASSSLPSWCVGCVNMHAHVCFVGSSLENSILRVGREEKIDFPGYWAVAFHVEISYLEQQTHWALGCRFNLTGQLLIMDSSRTQHHFYQLKIPTCQIFLSSSKFVLFQLGSKKQITFGVPFPFENASLSKLKVRHSQCIEINNFQYHDSGIRHG